MMKLGRNRVKHLICILKDQLLLMSRSSPIYNTVVKATNHCRPSSPPSAHRIEAVLSLGHGTRATSCACIEAIMDRLHGAPPDAFLSLKSLLLLHTILLRGTFILKDQLSFYPSSGGRNFLNLSHFDDPSAPWDLSSWVRWYAGVVEQGLISSRLIGHQETVSGLSNSDLFREFDALVRFVEQVSWSPDSFYLRKMDLVNEVVRLAAENYGLVQRDIWARVKECEGRIEPGLCLVELIGFLERLEQCRERLLMLFVNRKRNDALWELIAQVKDKAFAEKRKRDQTKMVVFGNGDFSEWTRFGEGLTDR